MPTTEQMLNVPFSIKINEAITVKVESLAPAWVTMILKRLAAYREKKDKPFLNEMLEKAGKEKSVNVTDIIESLYKNASEGVLGLDSEEIEREELEIIRLMTVPNVIWKQTKGNFDNYDWKFTIDDMHESFTEANLKQIYDEWWKRNPRFERKKKMMNPAA